jgi:ATP-dependent Clp protease adaptor protein ClpS
VYVLMKYFQHDTGTARKIMLHVHTRGVGVAGVYPFEIAETKVHQVLQFARENEMPLQASLRKSPDA